MAFEALVRRGFDVASTHHAESLLNGEFQQAHREVQAILEVFSINASELVAGGGGEAVFTQRLRNALASAGWEKRNLMIEKRLIDFVGQPGSEKYDRKSEKLIQALSHEIDHVKVFETGTVLLEIEWNNKDPFFDRDLENFKRLHGDGAASLGMIITRGRSMQSNMIELIERFGKRHGLTSAVALREHGLDPTSRQLTAYEKSAQRMGGDFTRAWAKAFVSDKYGTATTHWDKLQDRMKRGVGNPCPLVAIGLPETLIVED